MKIDLAPQHLKRFKDICVLLWKYGRSDLVRNIDNLESPEIPIIPADERPERLVDDLEAMGPTYIKLGQVLATRPDLVPEAYLKPLERLQDKVKSFPYSEVESIVSSELGVRISNAFSEFDQLPVAAASLGQVHKARLRDGRQVVIKVQRPDIGPQISSDFDVLRRIAHFFDNHTEIGKRYRFTSILEELYFALQQELDYEREARNMLTVSENLAEFGRIQIPQPIMDYSARRVLTMEFINGRKITSISPLAMLELDGLALAEELFHAYLKQVLVDGIFHADPHPGNVFITDDGRLALLDLGMVGRTTPAMQEHLLKILLAVSEGRSDDASEITTRISQTSAAFDKPAFDREMRKLLAVYQDRSQQANIGKSILEISGAAARYGLFVPSELTLLGKTLLQLEEAGKLLYPSYDAIDSVRRNVSRIMSQKMAKDFSRGNILHSLLEVKEFVTGLPGRLNKLLDTVSSNQFEIRIVTNDTKLVMEGLHKIANRITTGVILAALIIGASLLIRVDTPFRILGYPGLAILLFFGAALGSIWLIISIFIQDRKSERGNPHF